MGYEHISTGDMLRTEMKNKTEIGLSIQNIMDNGGLVSDEIVNELIKNKLSNTYKPFILDGYPRTLNQAIMLDELLNNINISNYEVIYLHINLEDALKRALGRLTCECGMSYNIYSDNLKPKHENTCDKCGRNLIKRSDDNEETFKVRFETFIKNNEPIMEFYKSKNKLHIIDTQIGKEKITEEIKDILHD